MQRRMAVWAAVCVFIQFAAGVAGHRPSVLPPGNTIVLDNAFRAVAVADRAADRGWETCRSLDELRARQRTMRANLIASLGGLPAKCPLESRTVARVPQDGCAIEKVIFAAEPNHHVTAHLFLPDPERYPGRRPGIVIPCGHSINGKGERSYKNGDSPRR